MLFIEGKSKVRNKQTDKKKYPNSLTNKTDPTGDIRMAFDVIEEQAPYASHDHYYSYSKVVPTTNEYLYRYEHLFKNRKNMLGPIASGDQIFSAILAGIDDFEVFDISRFPKYFLYLKKAAVQGLTLEEYKEFFGRRFISENCLPTKSKYYYLYQDKIRPYMDKEGLSFWDFFFKRYFLKEIYDGLSELNFLTDKVKARNNKFLQQKYYRELRDRLKDVRINVKTGNILDLATSYNSEYDVIYLSNIHSYIGIEGLLYLLHHLNTTPDGVMILAMVPGLWTGDNYIGDVDLRHFNGQPYKFTRYDGYIAGKRKV